MGREYIANTMLCHRLTLSLAAALTLVSTVMARGEAAPVPSGAELLERATGLFFNGSASTSMVRAMLEDCERSFTALAGSAERAYWLSRADYLAGIIERADKNNPAAERRFTRGISRLEESLRHSVIPDAYRLMADHYAQLMIVNGILYAAVTGWKVKQLCEKTLALDPASPKALLTLALYHMNAPAFAGGSLEKAVSMLADLRGRPGLEDEDRFAVRVWLGMAAEKRKDRAAARAAYAEAAEVFPGNGWVKDLLARTG
jgi:hypothetical protein